LKWILNNYYTNINLKQQKKRRVNFGGKMKNGTLSQLEEKEINMPEVKIQEKIKLKKHLEKWIKCSEYQVLFVHVYNF
jgi:restriction endonuclease S subunit